MYNIVLYAFHNNECFTKPIVVGSFNTDCHIIAETALTEYCLNVINEENKDKNITFIDKSFKDGIILKYNNKNNTYKRAVFYNDEVYLYIEDDTYFLYTIDNE